MYTFRVSIIAMPAPMQGRARPNAPACVGCGVLRRLISASISRFSRMQLAASRRSSADICGFGYVRQVIPLHVKVMLLPEKPSRPGVHALKARMDDSVVAPILSLW